MRSKAVYDSQAPLQRGGSEGLSYMDFVFDRLVKADNRSQKVNTPEWRRGSKLSCCIRLLSFLSATGVGDAYERENRNHTQRARK